MSDLPDWYVALTARPDEPDVVTPGAVPSDDPVSITNPAAYVASALERECREVAGCHEGGRNHRLNAAAFSLARLVAGKLPLKESDVVDSLTHAASACGLDAHETRATIRSGLSGGARHPLAWTQETDWTGATAQPFVVPAALAGLGDTPAPSDPVLDAEVARQRAQRAAKRLLDAEDSAAAYVRVPLRSAADFLAEPDPPITWAVEHLAQVGHNVLLTAQYKAGKTTNLLQLARSLADGVPFLDTFKVAPDLGRVAVLDYELDQAQHRRWFREVNIQRLERVVVGHWRGIRGRFDDERNIAQLIDDLKAEEVGFIILDPFAAVAKGVDENDNGAVGDFLNLLDHIKAESGAHTLVLSTHTGRREVEVGRERARGATRLDDWPDARWVLTKDDDDRRFFSASGRDIHVELGELTWDGATKRSTYTGKPPAVVRRQSLEDDVHAFVKAHPGCSGAAVESGVTGKGERIRAALDGLVRSELVVRSDGPRNGHTYAWLRDRGVSVATPFGDISTSSRDLVPTSSHPVPILSDDLVPAPIGGDEDEGRGRDEVER